MSLGREWPAEQLEGALNAVLPDDIRVTQVTATSDDFHARRDAVARTYRYLVVPRSQQTPIARRFAWHVRGDVDVPTAQRAGRSLIGTHDFAAFGRAPRPGGSTVRTVSHVRVYRALHVGATVGVRIVVIEVVADAFLYGMMRSIAGALVAVGQGRMSAAELDSLVRKPDRRQSTVAPAHGLHQWAVTYPSTHGAPTRITSESGS